MGPPPLPAPAPGHDDRAPGLGDELRRPPHLVPVGPGPPGRAVVPGAFGELGLAGRGLLDGGRVYPGRQALDGDLTRPHVFRYVQEHRARPPAHGLAEGRGEVVGDALGPENRPRPLGDRAHDLDLVHILHGPQVAAGEARTAGDDDDRRPGLMSDGHPRKGVDDARAGGHHGHARPAGVAGPPFGHHHRRFLVAGVDEPDAFGQEAVEDGGHVAAGKAEHASHAFGLEDLGHQVATVKSGLHQRTPPGRSRGLVTLLGELSENGLGFLP